MMSKSSTKRTRPKRDDTSIKIIWQSHRALNNAKQLADRTNGMGIWKNDFFDCRSFQTLTGGTIVQNNL